MSHGKDVINRYLTWLTSLVDSPNQDLIHNYKRLLATLNGVPYVYTYRKDMDREIDIFDMRDFYANLELSHGGPRAFRACMDAFHDNYPPSFLEFLVSLCVNYSEKVIVYPGNPSVAPEIFYDIMGNLEFLGCDDANFDQIGPIFVEEKCKNVLNHVKNHVIFHVKNGEKMDFWTILGVYAREKFEF